jgi:sugar-specific transcriptional regulator TrmB
MESMMQCDECVQTLMGLGLTLLQAKTYLALATLGKADVKIISKTSNVARQDIYRVMSVLQELGLGKKILAKPTMYEATPIKEGILLLLRKRKEETAELQKKTRLMLSNFNVNNDKTTLKEEDTQFKITSENTLLLKLLKTLSQKTQTSMDMVMPFQALQSSLFEHPKYFKWANKDVKIRLITQEAAEDSTIRKLQASTKNRFFEIKYFDVPANFGMHIFDDEEVTLSISDKGGLPCLWSNNPNVVKLARSYFNELWNKT